MIIHRLLLKIHPGAQWSLNGDEYKGLIWLDENIPKPTKEELETAWDNYRSEIEDDIAEETMNSDPDMPTYEEKIDALWAQVIENDSSKVNLLKSKIETVKVRYGRA